MKNYLISVFDCAIPANEAIYISIPITSGQTFLNWFSETGKRLEGNAYKEAHYTDVIVPNIQRASQYIKAIRTRYPNITVIEPTSLEVPQWNQNEYIDFWIEVINRFIMKAYFSPGWHYSRGCSAEFLSCIEKGIGVFDLNEQQISTAEGSSLINTAINEYRELNLETGFLSNIANKLDSNGAH